MDETEVEQWRIKKLIKSLKNANGNGTSVVSIILSPGASISKMNQKLTEEYGTATNIKSKVNQKSVLAALVSARERLKTYSKCPSNGLVIYSGEVVGEDGKEKRVVIDIEPFKPLNTTVYLCDNKFYTAPLEELLCDDKTFVFVIVDGDGYLLATVSGNAHQIIDKFDVSLPSKTRRGGQSANRFAHLRAEARYNYVKKVCEHLKTNLIIGDKVPFEGIIFAGNADIKHDILGAEPLDMRIKNKVISVIDISYGGPSGLSNAISLSAEKLGNMRYVVEKNLLSHYFELISKDSGLYAFAVVDTMAALEAGAVDSLLVWESLPLEIWETIMKDGSRRISYIDPKAQRNKDEGDNDENCEVETIVKESLLDYFVEHHNDFGAKLKFISGNTGEGAQFVKGFGGLGAILRYKMEFTNYDDFDDEYMST